MKPGELLQTKLDQMESIGHGEADNTDRLDLLLTVFDAHHDATQAQIAALEKRVAELEKANERLKWMVGVKTIGEQGPYRGPRNGGGFGEF